MEYPTHCIVCEEKCGTGDAIGELDGKTIMYHDECKPKLLQMIKDGKI